MGGRYRLTRICLLLVLCSFILLSCTTTSQVRNQDFTRGGRKDPFRAATRGLVLYPTSYDKRMGDQFEKQYVGKQFKLYDNPALLNYVRGIGNRIMDQAILDRGGVDYQFFILDDPMINAFAIPNGHMYIARGLLTIFENEAQLAAIMGHELGHVVERHSIKQMQGQQVGGILFQAVTGRQQPTLLENIGMSLISTSFGRSDEFKSDALGIKYAYAAGYDAEKLTEVFEKFAKRDSGGMPAFFRTHPLSDDRVRQAKGLWAIAQTRPEMKPAGDKLRVGAADYQRMVYPHTYRHYYPQVAKTLKKLYAAYGRKDLHGVMDLIDDRFRSKWLRRDYRDMKTEYQSTFNQALSVNSNVNIKQYRYIGANTVAVLYDRTTVYRYSGKPSHTEKKYEMVIFTRRTLKNTKKADDDKNKKESFGPWRMVGLEDGGDW